MGSPRSNDFFDNITEVDLGLIINQPSAFSESDQPILPEESEPVDPYLIDSSDPRLNGFKLDEISNDTNQTSTPETLELNQRYQNFLLQTITLQMNLLREEMMQEVNSLKTKVNSLEQENFALKKQNALIPALPALLKDVQILKDQKELFNRYIASHNDRLNLLTDTNNRCTDRLNSLTLANNQIVDVLKPMFFDSAIFTNQQLYANLTNQSHAVQPATPQHTTPTKPQQITSSPTSKVVNNSLSLQSTETFKPTQLPVDNQERTGFYATGYRENLLLQQAPQKRSAEKDLSKNENKRQFKGPSS